MIFRALRFILVMASALLLARWLTWMFTALTESLLRRG